MSQNNNKLSTEPYKGVRDFYPEDWFIENYIFNTWRKTLESFGYQEYNASILEPAELYKAKSGEEIVNEQTYTFIDRGDREVTLRPEMTPTVARLVAGRRRELSFPLRLFSIPNVFRYERPQRGRLREHFQLNVDIFGLQNIYADIELITVSDAIMKNFGAKQSDFVIKISSRKLLSSLFSDWYELNEDQSIRMQKLIDKKNKISPELFEQLSTEIVGKPFEFLNLEKSNPQYEEVMAFPNIKSAKDELDLVILKLKERGIDNVVYDETLIRGFDYYTGIIFEVFDTSPENNRALFGGGRYDNLLKMFGEDNIPCAGFGMGDVTLKDFLETRGVVPKYKPSADVMICIMEEDDSIIGYSNEIAMDLMSKGINVDINYSFKSIGDQIKSATKKEIPYCIVIGGNEYESKSYKIKDLSNGEEVSHIAKN